MPKLSPHPRQSKCRRVEFWQAQAQTQAQVQPWAQDQVVNALPLPGMDQEDQTGEPPALLTNRTLQEELPDSTTYYHSCVAGEVLQTMLELNAVSRFCRAMEWQAALSEDYRMVASWRMIVRLFDIRVPGVCAWEIQPPGGPLFLYEWFRIARYVNPNKCSAASSKG